MPERRGCNCCHDGNVAVKGPNGYMWHEYPGEESEPCMAQAPTYSEDDLKAADAFLAEHPTYPQWHDWDRLQLARFRAEGRREAEEDAQPKLQEAFDSEVRALHKLDAAEARLREVERERDDERRQRILLQEIHRETDVLILRAEAAESQVRELQAMLDEIRKDPAYHANDANWQRGFNAGRAELREYRAALADLKWDQWGEVNGWPNQERVEALLARTAEGVD